MRAEGRDFDRFDDFCDHLLVVDRDVLDEDGQPAVVGTYRFMRSEQARKAGGFYTAGEYDIAPMLAALPPGARALELGRSCILKDYRTKPATMQLLWHGVMRYVARFSIDLMFGCASLQGTDPESMALPLSYLHHFHRMPPEIRVRARPELYVEMNRMPKDDIAFKDALRALPPMIKGYVRAGCMIGDGAVIDRQFGTTDVLIYLPVDDMDAALQEPLRHRRLTAQPFAATFASIASQISAAKSAPPKRLISWMPVGEVTLISVR